ncbi:MAG: DUF4013 domain-containing protein [Burkholderiaceae bacterium]|nr:DUF4013 domain-containing protein [Burkholderiaceae bacterium]
MTTPSAPPTTTADWAASENGAPAATPFWQRVPKFFQLPLDRAVATRILMMSAAAVLSPLALLLGFFGFLLMMVVLFCVVVIGAKFGFTIIERSAQGFLRPSDYPQVEVESSWARPFKYVAINIVFVLVLVAVVIVTTSEALAWVAWVILFGIAMPAAVMRLVMTGSLRRAISPGGIVEVIARIGKPYIALCVFVFFADLCRTYGTGLIAGAGGIGTAMTAAAGGAKASLGAGVFVLMFLIVAGFWYFTYMICALIGYAMYQYAEALEITVIGPGETRGPATRRVDVKARSRDAMVAKMVASGDVREAIEVINDDLRERPHDLSLHARLHKLLLAEGYRPRIEDHTEKYLNLLMKTDNAREALPLVEEALGRDAAWTPRTVEHVVPLARAAMAASKAHLAAQLIKGFDKKHRMHPDIPAVYLIGAQLMLQQGGPATAQARLILEHLVQKYPGDPAAAEGKRTLDRLDRLAAPPTIPR